MPVEHSTQLSFAQDLAVISGTPNDFTRLNGDGGGFGLWQQAGLENIVPKFLAARDSVVAHFIRFDNLFDNDEEAKVGHKTFAYGIYPPDILPVVGTIMDHASKSLGDQKSQRAIFSSLEAVEALSRALGVIDEYKGNLEEKTGRPYSQRTAFAAMRQEADEHGDNFFGLFLRQMGEARKKAIRTIQTFENIVPSDTTVRVGRHNRKKFDAVVSHILTAEEESKNGVHFSPVFSEKLNDPNTKVVIVSIDLSSTLIATETHGSKHWVGVINDQLIRIAGEFYERYGDTKQLVVAFNTGMDASYLRGVTEVAFDPTAHMRVMGLAEMGGVVVTYAPNGKEKIEVTVKNQNLYKEQLRALEKHIVFLIKEDVTTHQKQSMVSIAIARRLKDGGEFLHTAKANGAVVDERWIEQQVQLYLQETSTRLTHDLATMSLAAEVLNQDLVERVTNTLVEIGVAGKDGVLGTSDDLPNDVVEAIQTAFARGNHALSNDIARLGDQIKMVRTLLENLQIKFNAVAGYVDIKLPFDKISSLFTQTMKMYGVTPDQMMVIHHGDSVVDIGQPVDGGTVFIVGMANSVPEFAEYVRGRDEFGVMTERVATFGLHDALTGIERVIVNPLPVGRSEEVILFDAMGNTF